MNLNLKKLTIYTLLTALVISGIVFAGSLIPSVNTTQSNFVTLEDIYQRTQLFDGFSPSGHDISYSLSSLEWASSEMPGHYQTWDAGSEYCTSLGGGWRLPTKDELLSKYNENHSLPPGFLEEYYWGETYPSNSSYAYVVGMWSGSGAVYINPKSSLYAVVRCVRDVVSVPASGTMHTLNDIKNSIKSIMVPAESDVKAGVSYGNARRTLVGTMTPNCTPGSNTNGPIYTSATTSDKLLPSTAPESTMLTLEDAYQRMYNFDFSTTSVPAHTLSTSSNPSGSMHTLQDIWDAMNEITLPSQSEVRQGTYFGQASHPKVGTLLESCQATAPTSITMGRGITNPVGGVSIISIPADGASTTGSVIDWTAGTADRIIFTVTDGGSALSTITINAAPYTSGTDYTITSTSTLTIIVTTAEAGKVSGIRTFIISVAAAVTVPGSPTNVVATAGDTQATVTFSAPVSDGGSAITGYTVTSSPGSIIATGSVSPITVTGLTNGTAYTFTVTATNAIGTSTASAASNSVTPAIPPSLGDSYQGGKVAYILQPGDIGYDANVQHGLIAAIEQYQAASIAWITGGNTQTTLNGNLSTAIGTGQANTTFMMAQSGYTGGAAQACNDYISGAYSDWYLPSYNELDKLYVNRAVIGPFGTGYGYWSSSERDGGSGWCIYFDSGMHGSQAKSYVNMFVRCVRSY